MFLTKILFLILIIICIFFYILYIWDFAFVLLVIAVSLPIVMFVTTLITKFFLSAELAFSDNTAAKNENFPVQLCISNRSIFPLGKAEAYIEYYNIFNNEITNLELHLPVPARNSQRVTFKLNSKFCGIIKIKCACIKIYDPLRIFCFKTCKNISTEITVMPDNHDISGLSVCNDHVNEESNSFSEYTSGDDPSEVFDLRDYIPGDKLNRIHWKLSSKKDNLIVKEYSLPTDASSMIFLDLKCYEDSAYTLPVFDTLIETLFSLSGFMLQNERCHTIAFYNSIQNCFTKYNVSNEEDLSITVREIIRSFNDNLFCESPDRFFNEYQLNSLSSFTFISSSSELSFFSNIDDNVEADIKNALIVVKSKDSALENISKHTDINTIPVVIGRISSSIKDIEV